MSLFDQIIINHDKFPVTRRGVIFQTKSLDRMLEDYRIDRRGLLWIRKVKRKFVRNKSYPLGGYAKEVSFKWKRLKDVEGELCVYTSTPYSKKLLEYTLILEGGRLKKVVRGCRNYD
jgi:hypothetical protein